MRTVRIFTDFRRARATAERTARPSAALDRARVPRAPARRADARTPPSDRGDGCGRARAAARSRRAPDAGTKLPVEADGAAREQLPQSERCRGRRRARSAVRDRRRARETRHEHPLSLRPERSAITEATRTRASATPPPSGPIALSGGSSSVPRPTSAPDRAPSPLPGEPFSRARRTNASRRHTPSRRGELERARWPDAADLGRRRSCSARVDSTQPRWDSTSGGMSRFAKRVGTVTTSPAPAARAASPAARGETRTV